MRKTAITLLCLAALTATAAPPPQEECDPNGISKNYQWCRKDGGSEAACRIISLYSHDANGCPVNPFSTASPKPIKHCDWNAAQHVYDACLERGASRDSCRKLALDSGRWNGEACPNPDR